MDTPTIIILAACYIGICVLNYILIKRFLTTGESESYWWLWTSTDRIETIVLSALGPIATCGVLSAMFAYWFKNRDWNKPAKW